MPVRLLSFPTLNDWLINLLKSFAKLLKSIFKPSTFIVVCLPISFTAFWIFLTDCAWSTSSLTPRLSGLLPSMILSLPYLILKQLHHSNSSFIYQFMVMIKFLFYSIFSKKRDKNALKIKASYLFSYSSYL